MAEEILKLVHELAFKGDPEESLKFIMDDYIERKIAECDEQIKNFEETYGMSFEEFERNMKDRSFAEKVQREIGVIQVENDYFDWVSAIDHRDYLMWKRKKLREVV